MIKFTMNAHTGYQQKPRKWNMMETLIGTVNRKWKVMTIFLRPPPPAPLKWKVTIFLNFVENFTLQLAYELAII